MELVQLFTYITYFCYYFAIDFLLLFAITTVTCNNLLSKKGNANLIKKNACDSRF